MLVRIYKGLLLGVTLSVLGSGVVLGLFFNSEWQSRMRSVVRERSVEVRDLIQGLFADGLTPERVAELVHPLLAENHATAAVFSEDGELLYLFAGRDAPKPEWDDDLVAEAQRTGFALVLAQRRMRVGLPISLGAHTRAFLGITVRQPAWIRGGALARISLGLAVLLAAGLLIAYFVSRNLAAPLVALTQTVHAFGAGTLSARASVSGKDELAQLGHGINLMAERISSLLADKQRLLGDVSHELKTPLWRLRLSLELARRGAGPQTSEYLAKADAQVEALGALVDELLTFSQLDAASDTATLHVQSVASVVVPVLDAFASERFVVNLQPAQLPLDGRLFSRALSNVAKNALKYAPDGTQVAVNGIRDGAFYTVTVEDRGPGVPETELDRIFEPFYRTDASRTADTGGTGLGLAIARRCLTAHKGRIAASLRDGGGLVIAMQIPVG